MTSMLLRAAIRRVSRPLMEMEIIEAGDLTWTDDGYETVPAWAVGRTAAWSGGGDLRRFYGRDCDVWVDPWEGMQSDS